MGIFDDNTIEHKCEECDEKAFWAVMDTIEADVSFLCDKHYNKRCEDKDYDNTHYPIAMWVYEKFKIQEVFDKPAGDLTDFLWLVDDLEEQKKEAIEAEDFESAGRIDKVLKKYYKEIG